LVEIEELGDGDLDREYLAREVAIWKL